MNGLERAWYDKATWLTMLLPVSLIFIALAKIRKILQRRSQSAHPLPVIVVGNINVGGTGKTPMVMRLSKQLREEGFMPGIVSRGYGSRAPAYPYLVKPESPVLHAGDEALLLVQNTQVPVVIGSDRNACINKLLQESDCDLVISDDGLQHYKMQRDIEIVMIDGQRLFANGWCLPAGPLREPISRLASVDMVVVNGSAKGKGSRKKNAQLNNQLAGVAKFEMAIAAKRIVNLKTGETKPFNGAPFRMGSKLQVVTGIGNPQRFYELLQALPYEVNTIEFADHHDFTEADFEQLSKQERLDPHHPIVMTAKDAIKCKAFAKENFWYVDAEASLPEEFFERVKQLVYAARHKKKYANNV